MKSKLELALEDLDSKADILKSNKAKETIKEKAVRMVERQLTFYSEEHIRTIKHCSDIIDRANNLLFEASVLRNLVVMGLAANVIIKQDLNEKLKIQSGFTALEEVAGIIELDKVSFHPGRDICVGEFLYSIAENGIITLLDSKPDSSD